MGDDGHYQHPHFDLTLCVCYQVGGFSFDTSGDNENNRVALGGRGKANIELVL